MNILIVDDNVELAENLAEILEDEGHTTRVFERPEQALSAAEDAPFDAALLDVRLPGMDGVRLFKELRQICGEARYLLMTAFSSDRRLREAEEAGVHGVLHKPIPLPALLELLRPRIRVQPILVVEDDDALRENLSEALEELGFEVCAVATVAAAASEVGEASRRPAAIVLDVRLPDGDGLRFAEEVRAAYPIPIVLITGLGAEEVGEELGGTTLLRKPFAPDQLHAQLTSLGVGSRTSS